MRREQRRPQRANREVQRRDGAMSATCWLQHAIGGERFMIRGLTFVVALFAAAAGKDRSVSRYRLS